MDHRASVRAVRALVAGPGAFYAALERAPDYEPQDFAAFLTHHKLLDWVAPALTSERARALVTPEFRASLRAHQSARRERNQELLRASREIGAAFAQSDLACLFLKGLYFGRRFYGDVNRRHQADVDILVRADRFEAALAALARLGFDTQTNLDDGRPVVERLRDIRGRARAKAPHAITVRRDALRLDLHWCLDSRSVDRTDEEGLWTRRRAFALDDFRFETLGDEDTFGFLLASLCADLRRGACRAKHFLDLDLMLREFDPALAWEDFFSRQRAQGTLSLAVNVLAVYFDLWGRAAEFPGIVGALGPHLHRVELRAGAETLALMERPRGNRENRLWYRRIHPRSRWRYWSWRLTRDLPHTLRRLTRSRGFSLPGS